MGKILVKVDPTETVVGNMTKRVLKIIREEYNHCKGTSDLEETLQTIVGTTTSNLSEFDDQVQADDIKDSICLAINELLSELETSGGSIASQALEHIYPDEVIMTIGRSKTVEAFIRYAAKKDRKFQVIIAECAPFCNVIILEPLSFAQYFIWKLVLGSRVGFVFIERQYQHHFDSRLGHFRCDVNGVTWSMKV